MAITLTIGSTVIDFPSSGASPDWSPAVIQFAEAVQNALSGVVGPFDVSPQTFIIDQYNPGTNVSIPNLAFPTSSVRGAEIVYTVYRNTSSVTLAEKGSIQIVYNPTNSVGHKWQITRQYTGDSKTLFTITDNGQVQMTNTTIAGTGHNGKIFFSAKAELQ